MMRLSRAELGILAYVTALGVAAVASWFVADIVSGPWPGGPGAWTDPAGLPVILSRFVTIVLIAAVLFGLAWLYPVIRRDAHERGRLARESRSYMEAALTDPLTGLQNRRYFDDALGEFMREFGSIDRPLAMLILDIDHFKQVNDTYGHDGGDMVLRAVSLCLLQHTRYHDVLARIGGEEFAVILPNTDAPALQRIAERIRAAIADLPVVLKETRVPITASFGIAVWDGGENAQALIKRADENLYAAKSGGRNRVASTGQASETARPAAPAQPIFGTGLSTPGSNRTARSGRAQAGR